MSASGTAISELSSAEAWTLLAEDPDAVLIDVRTRAEWTFVGVPDLSAIGKEPVLIEWQRFPSMEHDAEFVAALAGHLAAAGVPAEAPLLFMCRSGGRSLAAARAMAGAGFSRCVNVGDGFEGGLDASRRRGTVSGWKAAGLPWIQS